MADIRQKAVATANSYDQGNIAGLDDAMTRRLIASTVLTESHGGDLAVTNRQGYVGRYQAGAGWLADAGYVNADKLKEAMSGYKSEWAWASAGGMSKFLENPANWNNGLSLDKYKASGDLQDRAFKINCDKTYAQAVKAGVLDADDSPQKVAGFLKARHIAGYGGAVAAATGGRVYRDSNGTSNYDYMHDITRNRDGLNQYMSQGERTQTSPNAASPTQSAGADGKLSPGEKGAEVEALQKKLNALGYTDAASHKLGEDGKYGKLTREAVEQFQRENGLQPTGVADAATLKLVDKGMTRFAMNDSVLQPGEKGPDVRSLQQSLVDAGHKGADGKPLTVDGVYGDNTKAAVAAYQKANDLPQTGIADKATLVRMGELIVVETREPKPATDPAKSTDQPTLADKPNLANPNHPDHKLYQQAVSNLEQLGPSGGFKSREELVNAAAAVAADARISGLSDISHISRTTTANGQTLLIAVEGNPLNPASKNSYVDYNQAVNQTVDQSTKTMQQVQETRQALKPPSEEPPKHDTPNRGMSGP